MALRTPFANDAKTYGFEHFRGMLEAGLQEGVLNMGGAGTDLKVTPNATLLRVDVAAGGALVKGDSGTPALGLTQGLYLAINDAAIAPAVTHPAADATLPRIDQIVLYVRDSQDLGSTADDVYLDVVTGVATTGATLDNRTGAAALPSNALRLADVLIPAAATTVLAANVRDRRPWARGFFWRATRNTGNYTGPFTTVSLLDSTNLFPRLECSGVPVRLTLTAGITHSVAGTGISQGAYFDGGYANGGGTFYTNVVTAGNYLNGAYVDAFTPAAGSRGIGPAAQAAATVTILGSASSPLNVTIEEILRPNASN